MTSEICKLENDLCRCCLSKGVFINLAEPCKHLEEKETYADMLRDSLDVHITPVLGELSTVTFTICDSCASQLHSAVKFKKQVLISEERFKDMYSKNFINVADSTLPPQVKLELRDETDDDYEEDFTQMDFDNDDTIIDIKLENTKKVRAKKPKVKSKTKKAGKKVGKAKKGKDTPKVEAEAEADEADVKTEDAEKRGEKTPTAPKFRLRNDDFTQDGDLLKCARCDKTYDKMFSLRFHVKSKHYKIPRYTCPYCDKEFMTQAPFTVHKLEKHNVDDRYKCNACRGTFNTKVQLRKHINNFHMLGERYKCEFCEYESFSFEGLYKHKFKHRTVKNYHCRFCRKSFLRKATLDLHERIHTGDRRKVCQVCGQAFVQKASLNYHMTKYHPEVNF